MQQQGALNSILTNIANRNYRANRSGRVLQKKKLENLQRTDRQTSRQTNKQTDKQTNKQTENSITEATLIPCGSSGGAGQLQRTIEVENCRKL